MSQRDPQRPGGQRPPAAQAGDLAGVGLQFAVSILAFVFGGAWLDRKLGTDPWMLLVGVFVGGGAAFWSMYRRLVVDPQRRRDRGEK